MTGKNNTRLDIFFFLFLNVKLRFSYNEIQSLTLKE